MDNHKIAGRLLGANQDFLAGRKSISGLGLRYFHLCRRRTSFPREMPGVGEREFIELDLGTGYNGLLSPERSHKGNSSPSMATFHELKAQADALAKQAEEARLAELDSIIIVIREQIAEYDITPEQIFGRRRAVASSTHAPVAPKYRDPKTGTTWSGRGKAPQWIANAKNRDRFLIPDAE